MMGGNIEAIGKCIVTITNSGSLFKPLVKNEQLLSKLQQNKVKQKLHYDKNSRDLPKRNAGATVCV